MESVDERILRQAGNSAATLMQAAVADIDALFGDGYARENPALVAQFMRTAVIDSSAYAIVEHIGAAIDRIADAISGDR